MTAERLLIVLFGHGAAISPNGDRVRVEAPHGVLTPAVREALAAHKANLLQLLAVVKRYRTLLRDEDLDEAAFRNAQARLIDELGPALTTAVRQAVEREGVGHDLRHA